jgi:hypothetical protein
VKEPKWEAYRVDEKRDPEGIKQRKLHAFMLAFIGWRADIKGIVEARDAIVDDIKQPKKRETVKESHEGAAGSPVPKKRTPATPNVRSRKKRASR